MKKLTYIILLLVIMALLATPVLASIGNSIWTMKCPWDASVIITEYEDEAYIVECFQFIEKGK